MKNIKFVLAALAMGLSANASAMPPQVPDSYYIQLRGWVYGAILSSYRPCVGPAGSVCRGG